MRAVAALVALSLAALSPARAVAKPLDAATLEKLAHQGLSDSAILKLARSEGLSRALTPTEVLDLGNSGLSAALLSRLVLLGDGADPIRVEELDGVTVITGRDEPPAEVLEERHEEPWPEPAAEEWGATPAPPPPAPAVVVVNGATPAPPPGQDAPQSSGYPTGAVFGPSGGAVFLPARFGGNEPSAFGRTIVGFGGATECCVPVAVPIAPVFVAPEPTSRMIPVRTSRGTLWIPN